MKRFIILLAVVCSVFIGCGVSVSAYENGDVVEGYTLSFNTAYGGYSVLQDCKYYVFTGSRFYCFNTNDVVYSSGSFIGSGKYATFTVSGNTTSQRVDSYSLPLSLYISNITASNFDIYDVDDNLVFPAPPQTPEKLTAGMIPPNIRVFSAV